MPKDKHVTIIHQNDQQSRAFVELVKHYYEIRMIDITSLSAEDFSQSLLIIIQANLSDPQVIRLLREAISQPERENIPVLFLLNEFNRREVVQANMLGGTDYITYPCPDNHFISIMNNLVNRNVEKSWSKLSHTQEMALKVSLKVVENTFSNAFSGEKISQEDVKNSCNLIIEATAKDGLTDWMHAIRNHHSYTYRHSMMVCGYLISFGMYLGVNDSELQQLALGGILHDIGKAFTPLELLEKPTKLTPEEWVIMKQHPENSKEILQANNWDQDLVDMAIHHHERLDGTGYPYGLKGDEICDLARMTAIADVFSGLTDKRSYKTAMPAEKAIKIMLDMKGHLDLPLVKAFENIALSGGEEKLVRQA